MPSDRVYCPNCGSTELLHKTPGFWLPGFLVPDSWGGCIILAILELPFVIIIGIIHKLQGSNLGIAEDYYVCKVCGCKWKWEMIKSESSHKRSPRTGSPTVWKALFLVILLLWLGVWLGVGFCFFVTIIEFLWRQ